MTCISTEYLLWKKVGNEESILTYFSNNSYSTIY